MKVIVCGAGQVGSSIALQLASENNDVTVIDQQSERIHKLGDTLDVKAIVGFASHPSVLERAGAAEADMLIAVTVSDEVNMVAAQVAHSIFNIPMRIARIRNQNYLNPMWNDLYRRDHMPIDVIISPEVEVAQAIENRLHVPGALDMVPFADRKASMLAVRCMLDCPMIGATVRDVRERLKPYRAVMVGAIRDDHFQVSQANDKVLPGDEVYILVDTESISAVMQLLGHEEEEARRILILGGGNIGFSLAERLEQSNFHVNAKIIELSRPRAEYIAERLKHTTVVLGSGMDKDILAETHVDLTETIIAVSNDDKVNILASLLAKRYGCQRAITLVNDMNYMPLVSNLGIDVVVSPRETTISSILRHIRRGKIRGAHSVHNGEGEVIEAEVVENSPLAGKAVAAIHFPQGAVLGLVVRDQEVIVPEEDLVIHPGDRLILACMTQVVNKLEKVFSIQLEYF